MTRSPSVPEHAAEADLLARLGLDGSASDDQVDAAYEALAAFLDRAPAGLRAWAATRLAEVDEAYVLLRDPRRADPVAAGDLLELDDAPAPGVTRSAPPLPNRPPDRRPAPAPRSNGAGSGSHARAAMLGDALGGGEWYEATAPDAEEAPARAPGRREPARREPARREPARRQAVVRRGGRLELTESHGDRSTIARLRKPALAAAAVIAIGAVIVTGYQLGAPSVPGLTGTPAPFTSTPVVDQARVTAYMEKLAVNDRDTEALQGLANLYFAVSDFTTADLWLQRLLAIEPDNVSALLGAGAAAYNLGKLVEAEAAWTRAAELDPDNAEVYYDLGFLYLAQDPPDLARVEQAWRTVIELDPDSQIAQTVSEHLDSIAAMASPSPAAGSPGPLASPDGGPAPSATAPSGGASPGASPGG